MDAILYIAGRAIRLGGIAASLNKVLLPFDGKTLLERHVMLLKQAGIKKLYCVTGHMRENLQAVFPEYSAKYGLPIEEIYNPDFIEGSVLSMAVSLPIFRNRTEPILIMDGDVLYDSRLLKALVNSPAKTALLWDRNYATIDDDPVLVPLRNGRPFEFVKKWKGEADKIGESIGFLKVDPSHFRLLIERTEARLTGTARNDSLDDVLREMVQADLFEAVDITGLPWTEIDFPHDLDFAAKTILPQLEA